MQKIKNQKMKDFQNKPALLESKGTGTQAFFTAYAMSNTNTNNPVSITKKIET